MTFHSSLPTLRRLAVVTSSIMVLFSSFTAQAADTDIPKDNDTFRRDPILPSVFKKEAPANVQDLREMEAHIQKVLKKIMPCTVGVRVGGASGSGVIVSEDGYVLTAGHVSGKADQEVVIFLHDGRRLKGKTLGANQGIDSGMIKITEEGKWPFVNMGNSSEVNKGDWCITLGHPGGYKPGRTPVLRLGRILNRTNSIIQTDCTLVGGDSGGPLFDVRGKVIGIHSRIGGSIAANIHVPVDTYRDTWDRLAMGEVWGGLFGNNRVANSPYMGVQLDTEAEECKISQVLPDSPAAKAGLQANDVLLTFDGKKVATAQDLTSFIQKRKVGDEIVLEIQRETKTIKLKVVLGKRSS